MPKSLSPMRWFETRRLTDAEIALGRSVFGEEIAWARVRIMQAPPLTFTAMVPFGRTIVFSRWKAQRDFTQAPLADQGWFVHELAHVWQARRGVVLALAKLAALSRGAYAYKARKNAKLKSYNIERQAEIARHLFLARAGAPSRKSADKEWLEEVWAKR